MNTWPDRRPRMARTRADEEPLAGPVLIVFAREPIPGQTKTRLIPRLGARNAAVLADAFIRDALSKASHVGSIAIAAATTGDPRHSRYFCGLARRFGAELIGQGEGGLGARMARVLMRYSERGAILMGADTPSLPVVLLARGVALMDRARLVIGPSLDGGYYLMGVRGPLPDIFRNIRWGRRTVLEETVAGLKRDRMKYALAPAWYDIDRWTDVMLLAEHLRVIEATGAPSPCPATARVLAKIFSKGSLRGDPSVTPTELS
ncbi:MAG: TIGR04282 family arsenosugar biosynthesis glycosyltransferase [Candidatus Binataceae bacterium]